MTLLRDKRGVSALEFAFFLPLLMVILVGVAEFGRLFLATQKVQNGAFILADLAARDKTLREGDLANMFRAIDQVVAPFPFDARGRAYVSAVGVNAAGTPVVLWQRSGAGTAALASGLGAVGAQAALPGGLTLAAGETILVAEVVYDYAPLVAGQFEQEIRRTAYHRPRLGTLDVVLP